MVMTTGSSWGPRSRSLIVMPSELAAMDKIEAPKGPSLELLEAQTYFFLELEESSSASSNHVYDAPLGLIIIFCCLGLVLAPAYLVIASPFFAPWMTSRPFVSWTTLLFLVIVLDNYFNVLSQISLPYQSSDFILKLKALFGIMTLILVKLAISVLGPFGLCRSSFFRPFQEILIFSSHQYLSLWWVEESVIIISIIFLGL